LVRKSCSSPRVFDAVQDSRPMGHGTERGGEGLGRNSSLRFWSPVFSTQGMVGEGRGEKNPELFIRIGLKKEKGTGGEKRNVGKTTH